MTNKIKRYKKESAFSYTLGASVTIELIKTKPKQVQCVLIHSLYKDQEALIDLCNKHGIEYVKADGIFNSISQKENCFVAGMFHKYSGALNKNEPHIVLVNPSDMGNLGTIIRTAAGMGILNIGVIEPAVDIWNPKVVRASMGAVFSVTIQTLANFGEYQSTFPNHMLFPFMLSGRCTPEEISPCKLFSLVFGNEAAGLPLSFSELGLPIKIPLAATVDSFNLAVAVGIGAYIFGRKNGLLE